MHAWEQIQLTLDFIEEHLNEDISTEYLAGLAALSPFYYQRLFRRLAGIVIPYDNRGSKFPQFSFRQHLIQTFRGTLFNPYSPYRYFVRPATSAGLTQML